MISRLIVSPCAVLSTINGLQVINPPDVTTGSFAAILSYPERAEESRKRSTAHRFAIQGGFIETGVALSPTGT